MTFATAALPYLADPRPRPGGSARIRPPATAQNASRRRDYAKRAWSSFFAEFHQLADLRRSLRLASHFVDVVNRSPRSEGVVLLRIIHALQQGSRAGRMRQRVEVTPERLPRRDELVLLPILHPPRAERVHLISHAVPFLGRLPEALIRGMVPLRGALCHKRGG